MTVKIVANDRNDPPGKLADAELHFTSGPLEGLKLIGFGVWERANGCRAKRNVPGASIQREWGAALLRTASAAD